jgi:Ni/Co efflux regulator RcnB
LYDQSTFFDMQRSLLISGWLFSSSGEQHGSSSRNRSFPGDFMKAIQKVIALSTVAVVLSSGGSLFAQDHHDDHHDNHQYVRHEEWKKGARMNHDDWNRGERVDYRHYHLSAPPRGYEWRQVDGNYVLAAVATGLIASVVVASAAH